MKSTRIKQLKTLQHLAKKHKAFVIFTFRVTNPFDTYKWCGEFSPQETLDTIYIKENTFNEMLQALHTKVRTEL